MKNMMGKIIIFARESNGENLWVVKKKVVRQQMNLQSNTKMFKVRH
jgi:hypothetical protein